jgi:ABC-type branched-subunit amino acid transport system permease subunit
MVSLMVVFSLTKEILKTWVPVCLAMAVSILLVGLLSFPILRVEDTFGRWLFFVTLAAGATLLISFLLFEASHRLGLS